MRPIAFTRMNSM